MDAKLYSIVVTSTDAGAASNSISQAAVSVVWASHGRSQSLTPHSEDGRVSAACAGRWVSTVHSVVPG